MKKLILIVCHGNMHRSVIAEQCIKKELKQNGFDGACRVLSRGTQGTGGEDPPKHKNLREYENEWALTKPILEEIGITIPSDKVATPIDAQVVEETALILVMEESVLLTSHNSLVRQFPLMRFKMKLFVVRREILRIDSIVKTHIKQIIALAETLAMQKKRKT